METKVALSWYELLYAAQVGMQRTLRSVARGSNDRAHSNSEQRLWTESIEGAAGELAFAKWAGLYWSGSIDTFTKEPDVGPYHVRTRSKDWYDMIVRPHDADDEPYVLVIGKSPNFQVIGWLYGREAKQEQWKDTKGGGNPAYFVPKAELRPIGELPTPENLAVQRSFQTEEAPAAHS
jgi:hypothetical protein